MKTFLLIAYIVLMFAGSLVAQEGKGEQMAVSPAPNPLTNDDVIYMTKAGLSPTVIISKIKASKVDFHTAVADLKNLQDAQVSDTVVAAMVERQAEAHAPGPPIEYGNENAEHGDLSEIASKSRVFVAVDDPKSREIILKGLSEIVGLQVVNERKDADFGVWFAMRNVDAGSNYMLGTAHNIIVVGELDVYTYLPLRDGDTKGRIRILWQKTKKQDYSGGITLNRHPAQNAISEFMKDFKKIRKG